jgi:parallel beta-helix repeat protein
VKGLALTKNAFTATVGVFFCGLLILCSLQTVLAIDNGTYQEDSEKSYSWTTFKGNFERTGYTTSPAPESNATAWIFQTGGSISSAPVVAAGMVFVGSNDGYLYAVNATTGQEMWNFWTGPDINSPTVAHGHVFVTTKSGNVFAINIFTGLQSWSQTVTEQLGEGAPVVTNSKVIVNAKQSIFALNYSTGEIVWHENTIRAISISALSYSDGVIQALVIRNSTHAENDVALIMLHEEDGDFFSFMSYCSTLNQEIISSPTVVKGYNQMWPCLCAYKTELFFEVPNQKATLDGVTDASPAVADNICYLPTSSQVYAFDITTHDIKWQRAINGENCTSAPVVADEKVFFGMHNGYIYAFGALDGGFLWSYKTEGAIVAAPAVSDGVLFVGSLDGNLYAIGKVRKPLPVPKIGTVRICADGSVEPASAPLVTVDKQNYQLTNSFLGVIVVERDGVSLDGAGYVVFGIGNGTAISSTGNAIEIKNVVIKSMQVGLGGFDYGIYVEGYSNSTISKCTVTDCTEGIYISGMQNGVVSGNSANITLYESKENSISDNKGTLKLNKATDNRVLNNSGDIYLESSSQNTIKENSGAISLSDSANNTVTRNTLDNLPSGIVLKASNYNNITLNSITNSQTGLKLANSQKNNIAHNTITNNDRAVFVASSDNNTIFNNDISFNNQSIHIETSWNNTVYLNNFKSNTKQVDDIGQAFDLLSSQPRTAYQFLTNSKQQNNVLEPLNFVYFPISTNNWDNGSIGNYWSDCNGTDENGDGIIDTPYQVYKNNTDHYPLSKPAAIQTSTIPEMPFLTALLLVVSVTVSLAVFKKRKQLNAN